MYDYYPARDNINTVSGRTGSYQSLVTNDEVFNPNEVGLDQNNLGVQGGFSSRPNASIDVYQSLTQILSSLGHNLNENPREGFSIVSACTDTWKDTMISRHNNQKERILSLEHSLLVMNNTIQGSQTLFLGLQAEYRRMDEIITQHETIISRLRLEVETSSQRVNTVLSSVEERMKEFGI